MPSETRTTGTGGEPVERPTFYTRWLSPEGYLGAHLVVGFLVALVMGLLFDYVEDEVFDAEATLAADAGAQELVRRIASPALTSAMRLLTHLGDTGVLVGLSAVVSVVLGLQHSKRRLYAFLATMIGGSLLNVLLKNYYQRARPSTLGELATAHGFSFPSGHSMGSMLFFGSLAYVVYFSIDRGRAWRALAVLLCIVATLVVGFSRVYLGVHYFSDVVAGFAAGLCWIGVCLSGTEGWVKWRDWRRGRTLAADERSVPQEPGVARQRLDLDRARAAAERPAGRLAGAVLLLDDGDREVGGDRAAQRREAHLGVGV